MLRPPTFATEYLRVRDTLSRAEQIYLGTVEDAIVENPDPNLKGRFEVGGYRFALASGFVIKYRLLENGWVSFDELKDTRDPV
jgi:hypothetical protein